MAARLLLLLAQLSLVLAAFRSQVRGGDVPLRNYSGLQRRNRALYLASSTPSEEAINAAEQKENVS